MAFNLPSQKRAAAKTNAAPQQVPDKRAAWRGGQKDERRRRSANMSQSRLPPPMALDHNRPLRGFDVAPNATGGYL